MREWLSLEEAESKYKIKAVSLRKYMHRVGVVPDDCKSKIAGIWFIKESWLKEKYDLR